jgi:TonB-linked SusC/RagA family outer membrane protein
MGMFIILRINNPNNLNPIQMYHFYVKLFGRCNISVSERVAENHLPVRELISSRKPEYVLPFTCYILLFCLLLLTSTAKSQTVALSVKDAPLSEVFKLIKKQTGYDFVYTFDMLKDARTVTVQLKMPLSDVLNVCFKDQPFTYRIVAKTIIIIKKAETIHTEAVSDTSGQELVHGRIFDENNQPMAGATLRIVGGRSSAVSDDKGYYVVFTIPAGAHLFASYICYKTDTVAVKGRNEINFNLSPAATVMKEVIVSTGYQTLSQERATGSFAKPDMQVFSARANSSDILTRLDGLVPGLTVLKGTGSVASTTNRPGAAVQQVLVRGTSSVMMSSQPLYVLNGVEVADLSAINTNDVADITILKDASAAAIWGARAANGVVVITTKSGRRNQKVKISYSGYVNYQGKPDWSNMHTLSSAQYIGVAKQLFNPTLFSYGSLGTSFLSPDQQIMYDQSRGLISASQANRGLDSLSNIDNSAQVKKLLYRNAFSTNHTISASGGSEGYDFYTSFSFLDDQNSNPGQTNKTYQLTFNQNFNPLKILKVSLNTSLSNNITSLKNSISVSPYVLPYQLFQDANGNNLNIDYEQGLSPEVRADYQARSKVNLDYNPLNEANSVFSKGNTINVNVTGDFKLKLWKGLSFDGTYSFQRSPTTNENYADMSAYDMRKQLVDFTVAPTAASTPVYYLPISGGRYIDTHNEQKNWTVRNQLIYTTPLRDGNDNLNIQIGQEAQDLLYTLRSSTTYGYDLNLETFPLLNYATLNNGVFGTVTSGRNTFSSAPFSFDESDSRFTSYFGLFNYSFNRKFDLDASVRKDKSNLFASAQSGQKKPAYSIGGKWLLGREKFIQSIGWFNDLKIRATYGVTGNSPYLGAAALQDILYADAIDPNTGAGFSIAKPANKSLDWESTHTINLGLDFSVLNNRITTSIDLYNKHTTGLLGNKTTNPLTGVYSTVGNLGSLTNKGVEVNLHTVNLAARDFIWTTNLTFSFNHNKLDSYQELQANELTDVYRVSQASFVPGYSLSPIFAYRFAGLDNLGDPQIKLADGTLAKTYGAASAKDLVYMGSQVPKFNGGFSNTVGYKGFNLTANMIYNLGAVMRRDVNQFYSGRVAGTARGWNGNLTTDFLNRWQKPGDEAITNIPSYVADPFVDFTRRYTAYYTYADINVISASYIKLRDLTLSYNLPKVVLSDLKISSANIYVQTGNFMIWKANKYDIDPEYQDYKNGIRGVPPYNHNFAVGVNVTF